MKKIFFYASIACILAVSSCKDDEKPTYPGTPGAIQGATANECPQVFVDLSIGTIKDATSYQWYKNATVISGATVTTYRVTESGTYSVRGVNAAGEGPMSAGHAVTITVCPGEPEPPGEIQGANENECPEETVELSIGTITGAVSYQWYKNATAISEATGMTYTVTESGTYTVRGVNTNGEGPMSEGHVVTITACPPEAAGNIQGANANTCPEETVELSIGAITGAVSYQWYKNATAITGATEMTYTVTESGTYTVRGVNAAGEGPMSEGHAVTITACPPEAAGTIQGANTNCPDETVELSIGTIIGADSYQWYKDGEEIPGATGRSYTVTESGTYTVRGINAVGEGALSPGHVVTITLPCDPPPAPAGDITGANENVCPDEFVELSIDEIEGADSYQWYRNATAIAGATEMTYTATQSGTYTVAGINAGGPGEPSPGHVVTITSCVSFIDALVGDWDVVEFWIQSGTAYNNDHVVTIEKIDDTTIKIYNFSNVNDGNTGDPRGDEVIATVNSADQTILIDYQEFVPTWNSAYTTWLAPMIASTFCHNVGLPFLPQTVVTTGETYEIVFVNGSLSGTIGGVPYNVVYVAVGIDVNTGICAGGFGYTMGTTWTKQTSRSPAKPKRKGVVKNNYEVLSPIMETNIAKVKK